MTKIVISGASGDLGRRLTSLLIETVPPKDLRLVTRTPAKLAGKVPAEVEIFEGDYNRPEELEEAYRGCHTLMLISATFLGHRVTEHRNAIEAAKKAGIQHIVYTSYVGIHPKNPNRAASDHILTEADLHGCGIPWTILRDANYGNWVYEISILPALRTGEWISVEGEGRLAPVDKADVVRCIAKVLSAPADHAGVTYEISGPELFSFRQIAELAREIFNNPFKIREVTPDERLAIWDALGVPRTRTSHDAIHPEAEWFASDELVSGETAIAQGGYQGVLTDHVWMLTGRHPRRFRDYLEEMANAGTGRSIIEDVGGAHGAPA
jgi:NAD(P)H dehydrogenase (quinone)